MILIDKNGAKYRAIKKDNEYYLIIEYRDIDTKKIEVKGKKNVMTYIRENGLVKLADGTETVINYSGVLSFITGVDDPEASGYTFTIAEQPVSIMDYTTFTPINYPDVTKYIITVNDPNGKKVAEFNTINANSLAASALTGNYTVESNAHEANTIDAGYAYPEYSIFGGTFYTDANSVTQTINIETATDGEGHTLFTFSGTALSTIDANGTAGTAGTFKITFATLNN